MKKYRQDRNSNKKKDQHFVGQRIRAPKVMCIDSDNANLGVIPTEEALSIAKSSGLDLVQVSSGSRDKAPTCRIIDYSKFKYELSKKDKASKKKQRENAIKIKEIKFRPSTGENDLRIKAKQAQSFVDDGHRLKVTITFKGREMSHREVGHDTLRMFLDMLVGVEVVSDVSFAGRHMYTFLAKSVAQEKISA